MATASGTNETNKNAKPCYNESGECKIEVDFKKPILIFFNEKTGKKKIRYFFTDFTFTLLFKKSHSWICILAFLFAKEATCFITRNLFPSPSAINVTK